MASDGGIFAFGDASFMGSTGGTGVDDIVTLAPTAESTLQALLGLHSRADATLGSSLARAKTASPPPPDWMAISG